MPFFTDKCKTSNNIILLEKMKLSTTTKKFPTSLTKFSFDTVSKKDVLNLIKGLPGNKATVSNDIQVSAYYEKLGDISIKCIRSGFFLEILKETEVTPVLKKVIQHQKHRPVSTLSSF